MSIAFDRPSAQGHRQARWMKYWIVLLAAGDPVGSFPACDPRWAHWRPPRLAWGRKCAERIKAGKGILQSSTAYRTAT